MRFGRPLPWPYWRLWLAERFGWTLEYCNDLDIHEVHEMIDILQSADLARAHEQRKAQKHASRGRR